MKSLGMKAAMAMGLLLAAQAELPAAQQNVVRKQFNVSPGGLLRLSTFNGSIQVRAGQGDQVEVEILLKSRTDDSSRFAEMIRELDMDLSQSGGDVNVTVNRRGERRDWWRGGEGLHLEFNVTVPSVYNVDLKTSGGSIEVGDLKGRAEARTSGGSLRFGRVSGEVLGRTSGGSVAVEETEGTVDVKTSGGSISIGRARGDINAETSGGSIQVEEVYGSIDASTSGGSVNARIASQPQGDCRLSTSGGSVTVALSRAVGVDLDAETSSGKVISDLSVTGRASVRKDSLRGTINGGGPRLTLRTSGGNIYVKELR